MLINKFGKKIDPRAMAPQEERGMRVKRPGSPGYMHGKLEEARQGVAPPVTKPMTQRPQPQLLQEGFNRKLNGKGSDYRPGMPARQPSIREVPAIEESLYDLDDDLG